MTRTMQQQIDHIQSLYREWLSLEKRLEAAQKDWQRSREVMRELEQFYFEGRYQEFHSRIENGEAVDLHTGGEYSVMSEDALWNAFHDFTGLAWERVHTGIAVLDPKKD